MSQTEQVVLQGRPNIPGSASGTLLSSSVELSFWGGVNPLTGEIIDRFHPLSSRLLKDTVFAIPGGRGSCTGSATILELILNEMGPKALLFERVDEIITLGVMVAAEFFGRSIPVVVLSPSDFRRVLEWDGEFVHVQRGRVSNGSLGVDLVEQAAVKSFMAKSLDVRLTDYDHKVLQGDYGEATRFSLKVIIQMAQLMGAQELMDVSNAHVDIAWYGPGSVNLGKKLRDWGGRFRVPTTVNAINVDLRRWRALGVNPMFGAMCEELTQAFVEMGAKQSFTCAPYQGDNVPKLRDAVAWGESNAVIYANSVLGARTMKNSNMLEYLIALTGRAPRAGVYLDENRLASVWIKVEPPDATDDAFWPILGYCVGIITNARIPVIGGLEHLKPSTDDFKAFSAAFGTSSSASMYHMVGLTPEAPTIEAVCLDGVYPPSVDLTGTRLYSCWNEFNQGSIRRKVDLVSFGNPHFSFSEIKNLAHLCRGKIKSKDVAVVVTCGRSQHGLATQAGFVAELQEFGVEFLTDVCWCSIQEPVIKKEVQVIMTNSGSSTGTPPAWLLGARKS